VLARSEPEVAGAVIPDDNGAYRVTGTPTDPWKKQSFLSRRRPQIATTLEAIPQ
jgi:hypothetical protein